MAITIRLEETEIIKDALTTACTVQLKIIKENIVNHNTVNLHTIMTRYMRTKDVLEKITNRGFLDILIMEGGENG